MRSHRFSTTVLYSNNDQCAVFVFYHLCCGLVFGVRVNFKFLSLSLFTIVIYRQLGLLWPLFAFFLTFFWLDRFNPDFFVSSCLLPDYTSTRAQKHLNFSRYSWYMPNFVSGQSSPAMGLLWPPYAVRLILVGFSHNSQSDSRTI